MRLATAVVTGTCALLCAAPARGGDEPKDALMDAMVAELMRSAEGLAGKGEERMYYLAYGVTDAHSIHCSASYGAVDESGPEDANAGRSRTFDVALRVGSAKLDNTHKVRGEWSWGGFGSGSTLPIEDDPGPIRVALWHATDESYKQAVRALIKVKANKAARTEEEDKADDFSVETSHVDIGERLDEPFDAKAWKDRCKRLSALFKDHPTILSSSVSVSGSTGTMYFVDSDGARIREPRRFLRVFISGSVKADDGMDLDLYDSVEATAMEQLPTESELAAKTAQLIANLEKLREAPVIDPYNGPAIIMNRAAGVFFHEVFGHRAEGHRLKDEDEGQTFKKKLNEKVVPEFITVVDDPTQRKFGDMFLNGFYRFDDEGQPAQKVTLVENGTLKAFLMGRTPIDNFPHSNGHGRAQAGLTPVSRQGNLIAQSSKTVPFADLRKKLIDEVTARGKPYGLMFQDIAGGFTNTQRGAPQAFDVIPLVVFKVYTDGRPDELVRGVNLVGTPLASFEKILATADDYAVFNGYCGAESGWVPVSAVAPSLLVAEMEIEKKEKGSERVPILPPPLHPKTKWPEVKAPDDKPEGHDGGGN